jgi:hypothetical protein
MITASAPLATDFSARTSVKSATTPKNAAAAKVSQIGKAGERQICSSGMSQAQFMRDFPQTQHRTRSAKVNAHSTLGLHSVNVGTGATCLG